MNPKYTEAKRRLAFALDVPSMELAQQLVSELHHEVGIFKIGLELFMAAGVPIIEHAKDAGAEVFLDLKLHDIPETVTRAVKLAARIGVDYATVHAAGGEAMLKGAVEAAASLRPAMKLQAVTVLTSLSDSDAAQVGFRETVGGTVYSLARLARDCGIPGVVCSAHEVAQLRQSFPTMMYTVPGIRPAKASSNDQARIATPASAIRDGATMLVVGRPIRDAEDRVKAARAIVDEMASAL